MTKLLDSQILHQDIQEQRAIFAQKGWRDRFSIWMGDGEQVFYLECDETALYACDVVPAPPKEHYRRFVTKDRRHDTAETEKLRAAYPALFEKAENLLLRIHDTQDALDAGCWLAGPDANWWTLVTTVHGLVRWLPREQTEKKIRALFGACHNPYHDIGRSLWKDDEARAIYPDFTKREELYNDVGWLERAIQHLDSQTFLQIPAGIDLDTNPYIQQVHLYYRLEYFIKRRPTQQNQQNSKYPNTYKKAVQYFRFLSSRDATDPQNITYQLSPFVLVNPWASIISQEQFLQVLQQHQAILQEQIAQKPERYWLQNDEILTEIHKAMRNPKSEIVAAYQKYLQDGYKITGGPTTDMQWKIFYQAPHYYRESPTPDADGTTQIEEISDEKLAHVLTSLPMFGLHVLDAYQNTQGAQYAEPARSR